MIRIITVKSRLKILVEFKYDVEGLVLPIKLNVETLLQIVGKDICEYVQHEMNSWTWRTCQRGQRLGLTAQAD